MVRKTRDRLKILLPLLSKSINLESPLYHQKTVGFMMISEGIEVNLNLGKLIILPLNLEELLVTLTH